MVEVKKQKSGREGGVNDFEIQRASGGKSIFEFANARGRGVG